MGVRGCFGYSCRFGRLQLLSQCSWLWLRFRFSLIDIAICQKSVIPFVLTLSFNQIDMINLWCKAKSDVDVQIAQDYKVTALQNQYPVTLYKKMWHSVSFGFVNRDRIKPTFRLIVISPGLVIVHDIIETEMSNVQLKMPVLNEAVNMRTRTMVQRFWFCGVKSCLSLLIQGKSNHLNISGFDLVAVS